METSKNENYPVFKKWYEILNWIMDRCERFPKSVRFSFTSRILNFSLDIMELVIEAIYTKQRAYILRRINLYIEKLRVFFRLSFQRNYLSVNQYEFISKELNEFGRMIGGWAKQ